MMSSIKSSTKIETEGENVQQVGSELTPDVTEQASGITDNSIQDQSKTQSMEIIEIIEDSNDAISVSGKPQSNGGKGVSKENRSKVNSDKRKRSRSRSRQRDNESRKRTRRSSETKHGSRSRIRENRSNSREKRDRSKDQRISDMLQRRIDRLKEEIEHAKKELVIDSRDLRSRSKSLERKHLKRSRRSRSKSLNYKDSSRTGQRSRSISVERSDRSRPLPSVKQFLNATTNASNRDTQNLVVVERVSFRDESDEQLLLTKFQRCGPLVDSVFDKKNSKAFFYYGSRLDATDAVRNLNGRYYEGRYLKVQLADESNVELPVQKKCRYCSKDHRSESCPDRTKARDPVPKRRSRPRSRSLELRWPTNPRHPSSQLFDRDRSLSPLSSLIASESFQTGGIKPVSFPPKRMPTDLSASSSSLYMGRERLAKRVLMMKQMNSIVSYSSQDKSLNDFEVVATIGKGSYGQMYKAVDRNKEALRALKKMTTDSEKDGLSPSALQELRLLGRIDHPNIAKLLEIITDKHDNSRTKPVAFYFVYDYMNHDLKRLLQSKSLQLKTNDFAWLIKQLLSALSYCHQIGLVHCDVKPSNILINNRGDLKLTQFGFACFYDGKVESSTSVVNSNRKVPLWYRAPELLLGDKTLKPAIDIWSCGCVIGEMFSKKPIFLGSDEENQLEEISKVCGSPSPSSWPSVASLPMYSIMKKYGEYPRLFHDAFHYLPYMARNLLDHLLVMDPQKRLTAEKSLELDWVKNTEFPKMLPMMLMQLSDCHLLMSAKLPVENEKQSFHSLARTSDFSYTDQKKKFAETSGRNVYSKSIEKDIPDKVAITCYSESPFAREAKTYQQPSVGGLSRNFRGIPGPAAFEEPKKKPYIASEESKQRAFNPRVVDYGCQPSTLKPDNMDKQSALGVSSFASGRSEMLPRYSDQDDRSWMELDTRSLESKSSHRADFNPEPVKGGSASSAKAPRTDFPDERTYSAAVADLERLRMLSKQLEMIGKEKYLTAGTSKVETTDKHLQLQPTKEESAEASRIHFKSSSNRDFRKPLDSDLRDLKAAYQNDIPNIRAAKTEVYQPQVGTDSGFRSEHELKSNAFLSQSHQTGDFGEDLYSKNLDRASIYARERPMLSAHPTQQPTNMSPYSDPYGDRNLDPSRNSSSKVASYSAYEIPERVGSTPNNKVTSAQSASFTRGSQDASLYGSEMYPHARNVSATHYADGFDDARVYQQQYSNTLEQHPGSLQKDPTEWRNPQSRF